jgi:hypothetical protein
MGKVVLRDVNISVDGVDLSDHCTAVTVEDSAADVDSTAFGSVYTSAVKGLRTAQITATFQQDFASGSVDAKLDALNNSDDPFVVEVTPTSAAVGPTNPKYRLPESMLLGFTPLGGGVGDLSTTDVTFSNAGASGVVRLTS